MHEKYGFLKKINLKFNGFFQLPTLHSNFNYISYKKSSDRLQNGSCLIRVQS